MKRGIYLTLLTAVISGFSIFANKIFVMQADPLAFTTVRNMLVGLMLLVVVVGSGAIKSLKLLRIKDWSKLLFIGIFGGGVAFALFFSGLAQIGAVQGNLIHKTLFLWVTLLAIPLLKESLHPVQIIGYLFIILATFVVGGPLILTLNTGALLVLAATMLYAVENVVAKIALKNIDPKVVGMMRIWIGLPVLFMITLVQGKGQLLFAASTLNLPPLITSSLFLTGYILSWYHGLKLIPVSLAASILAIAPIITNLLISIFITHSLPQTQIQSTVLLALGAGLLLVKVVKPRPQIA